MQAVFQYSIYRNRICRARLAISQGKHLSVYGLAQRTFPCARPTSLEPAKFHLRQGPSCDFAARTPTDDHDQRRHRRQVRTRRPIAPAERLSLTRIFPASDPRPTKHISSTRQTTVNMSHESVWYSRPRTYGKGSREWYVHSASE